MADSPLSSNREQEQKYSVHGLFVMPELTDPAVGLVRSQAHPTQTLRTVYYDSPDLRLARDGITLRHRSGDGPTRWTLKLPAETRGTAGSGGLVRDEIELMGSGRDVPSELSELLTGWLRGVALGPVATLPTSRSILMLRSAEGDDILEVVGDTVSVQEGRRVVSRFREIEVEVKVKGELPPLALETVTNRLAAARAR